MPVAQRDHVFDNIFPYRAKTNSIVEDNPQEGFIDEDFAATVFDEAQAPEFVHEKVDSGARSPDHSRQSPLRHFGNHGFRPVLLAIASEQKKRAGQTFLAGVEELVYQVRLDSNASCKHVRQEAVRERMLSVEHANHLFSLDREHRGGRNRGRGRYALELARKAPFTQKIAWSKDTHNSFLAVYIDHRKLHTAFLNVHDVLRGIALRVDSLGSSVLDNFSRNTARSEICLNTENMLTMGSCLSGTRDCFHDTPAQDMSGYNLPVTPRPLQAAGVTSYDSGQISSVQL